MNWIDYNVASFFHQLLFDLIDAIVVLDRFFLQSLPSEAEPSRSHFEVVILEIVVVGPRLHLRELKRLGRGLAVGNSTGTIHFCRQVLLKPAP